MSIDFFVNYYEHAHKTKQYLGVIVISISLIGKTVSCHVHYV